MSSMPLILGEERPRILSREFRRRKQPKRCDSLPSLKLFPDNRALYVCQSCNFHNPLCALCPWCFGPCDSAALAVAIVRRRLSSPALLSGAQKIQLMAIERASASALAPPTLPPPGASAHQSLGASIGTMGKTRRRHRNAVLYSATDVVTTATTDEVLQPFLEQIAAARQENRDRELHKPALPELEATPPPPPAVTSPARPLRPLTTRTSRPQPPSPRTPTATKTTRTRMVRRDVVGLTVNTQGEPDTSAPSSPSPCLSPSPTPGLRRKHRMSVLRQRSSCSLRRRTTSTVGTCRRESAHASPAPSSSPTRPKTAASIASVSLMSTSTSTSTPVRVDVPASRSSASPSPAPKGSGSPSVRFGSPSPPPSPTYAHPRTPTPPKTRDRDDDPFPLGHPQRPLYTAIRKNMSRPSSPAPSAASFGGVGVVGDASFAHSRGYASVQTVAATVVYERGTRSLDLDRAHFPDPAARFGSLTRAAVHAHAHVPISSSPPPSSSKSPLPSLRRRNTQASMSMSTSRPVSPAHTPAFALAFPGPLFPSAGAGAAGCSVSGATELRMDLARSRSADGVPSDFAFREVIPPGSGAGGAGVKARVKSWGKSIKGFLRGVM